MDNDDATQTQTLDLVIRTPVEYALYYLAVHIPDVLREAEIPKAFLAQNQGAYGWVQRMLATETRTITREKIRLQDRVSDLVQQWHYWRSRAYVAERALAEGKDKATEMREAAELRAVTQEKEFLQAQVSQLQEDCDELHGRLAAEQSDTDHWRSLAYEATFSQPLRSYAEFEALFQPQDSGGLVLQPWFLTRIREALTAVRAAPTDIDVLVIKPRRGKLDARLVLKVWPWRALVDLDA